MTCVLLEFGLTFSDHRENQLEFSVCWNSFLSITAIFLFLNKAFSVFCCKCQASRIDCSFVTFYCQNTAGLFMSECILGAKIILELNLFFKKTSLQKFEAIAAEHIWAFVQSIYPTETSRVLYSQSAFFSLNILPLWFSPKTKLKEGIKKRIHACILKYSCKYL